MSVIAKAAISVCKILAVYRPVIDAVITSGVSGGHITTAQGADITAWLNAASSACTALKLLTGY
jgi:acetyl-CoA carboxylase alpha subunit